MAPNNGGLRCLKLAVTSDSGVQRLSISDSGDRGSYSCSLPSMNPKELDILSGEGRISWFNPYYGMLTLSGHLDSGCTTSVISRGGTVPGSSSSSPVGCRLAEVSRKRPAN